MLHPIFKTHLSAISQLFKANRVKCAYVFGSVTNEYFDENSDIDLMIDFEDGVGALEKGDVVWELHDALRQLLNREIDILIEGSLKNPYFIEEVNEKKQLIYAA